MYQLLPRLEAGEEENRTNNALIAHLFALYYCNRVEWLLHSFALVRNDELLPQHLLHFRLDILMQLIAAEWPYLSLLLERITVLQTLRLLDELFFELSIYSAVNQHSSWTAWRLPTVEA
jgi:hypothetical protein